MRSATCRAALPPAVPPGSTRSTTAPPTAGSLRAAGSETGPRASGPHAGDARGPIGLRSAFEMLLQARHQLDEIAWAEAVVELVDQDVLPGVAAGRGRA